MMAFLAKVKNSIFLHFFGTIEVMKGGLLFEKLYFIDTSHTLEHAQMIK